MAGVIGRRPRSARRAAPHARRLVAREQPARSPAWQRRAFSSSGCSPERGAACASAMPCCSAASDQPSAKRFQLARSLSSSARGSQPAFGEPERHHVVQLPPAPCHLLQRQRPAARPGRRKTSGASPAPLSPTRAALAPRGISSPKRFSSASRWPAARRKRSSSERPAASCGQQQAAASPPRICGRWLHHQTVEAGAGGRRGGCRRSSRQRRRCPAIDRLADPDGVGAGDGMCLLPVALK